MPVQHLPNPLGGHTFADLTLARRALTHPAAQRRDAADAAFDSERLEFLGDSVLGFLLASLLFERHPAAPEGELTRRRAAVVSRGSLAAASRRLGLPACIDAGDDAPSAARIRATDSAAENAFEALLGAVYLDAGLDAARTFALGALGTLDCAVPEESPRNRLQERLQARSGGANVAALLEYRTVSTDGPAHARRYVVEVWYEGACHGTGEGASVKSAAEVAARAALAHESAADAAAL